jgi:hypothetical protein
MAGFSLPASFLKDFHFCVPKSTRISIIQVESCFSPSRIWEVLDSQEQRGGDAFRLRRWSMPEERLLTDAELEAMERRCVEASPGPWTAEILGSLEEAKALGRFRWVQMEPEFGPWRIPTQSQVGVVWRAPNKLRKPDDTPLRIGLPGVVEVTAEDALFIAHAREDMPKLLSEVKRLRALLAKNSNGARKSG